ncbi:MAG: signal peptide peptidase SppA [Roseibium album]|uniref:signal peptide peptidase SppA n=1 Tax=Roseibium album TaxID=311410 RepID=UPI0032EF5957
MNSPTDQKPGLLRRIGNALTWTRLILSNLIFFGLLIVVLVMLFSGAPTPQVPARGALVLNPEGSVVEQRSPVDPLQQFFAPGSVLAEAELTDLLDALERARDDERIALVVLDLDDLQYLSTAHASLLGDGLVEFRKSGKQVVAYGSYYDQQPYLLASHADAIYLHPFGQVMLPGYNLSQLYFKNLLDRLDVNVRVFRTGEYKEIAEPFIRADMSDAAREANLELVNGLWSYYRDRVIGNRRLEAERLQRYTQDYDQAVAETDGDFARLAVEYHLVDELLTPDQARARIADEVGYDADGNFNGIGFRDYLAAVNGRPAPTGDTQIGVITAQGPIMMGRQMPGVIAADRLVGQLREVRKDDKIKALVLRVDSPGGSAFASELIRQELELTQLAGKPVVISMGPTAASGGYWISATADAIFAEPTTLTGSIGVVGIVPTFEKSLEAVGITSDGVRTTPLSSIDPLSGLSDATASVLQTGTDHTYRQFINLVARGRDMTPERVDELARGRVWLGNRAVDLGLVDALGGREAAIARAAELAGLTDYEVRRLAQPLTPRELLLQQLTGNAISGVLGGAASGWSDGAVGLTPLMRQAGDAWKLLRTLNDPRHSYALCLVCRVD